MNNPRVAIFVKIITVILFSACQNNDVSQLNKWLDNRPEFKKYKAIVIIPNSGCDGCITNAENFVIENCSKTNKIKYIFTEINSKKVLKSRLSHVYENENIFLDLGNEIRYSYLSNSFYPSILYLKKNKIEDIIYISPSNPDSLNHLLKVTER